jgi:cytochrome c553
MKKILILALFTLIGSVAAYGQGNAANGKSLTGTCMACHGEKGISMASAFPHLAGQQEKYLLKQMLEIQSGEREVPTMTGMLTNMSASDLADIAAFYASQPRAMGAAKADQVELGEAIYRAGIARKNIAACTACHSPTGNGNGPAGFPALAGQWPEYTIAQLKLFQSGERHNDGDSQMMRGTAMDMNDKEMNAVASYLYGLK